MSEIREGECNFEPTIVLYRFGKSNDLYQLRLIRTHSHLFRSHWTLVKGDPDAFWTRLWRSLRCHWHPFEPFPHPSFQSLHILLAIHGQFHPSGTVVLLPPLYKLLSGVFTVRFGSGPERVIVACTEFMVWVIRAENVFLHLKEALILARITWNDLPTCHSGDSFYAQNQQL